MELMIRLTKTGGKKVCVEPEGQEGIFLYPGEIRKCRLTDGMTMAEEEFEDIRINYALPRAKKRALGILLKRDMTLQGLREKLEGSYNDSRSIEEALSFVQECGYVDDMNYARDYLQSRRKRRSFRMIRQDLSRKGISQEILNHLFEEAGNQDREDVEEAVVKYARRFETEDPTAYRKICAHFMRKGYDQGLIRDILKEGWESV